jgi:K+-transporting ATPase ATPase C chain
MSEDRVRQLVEQHVEGRLFGLLGEPRVNVVALNMALDQVTAQ